jgi:hypothetical protein
MAKPCRSASSKRIKVGLVSGLLLVLGLNVAFAQQPQPRMQLFEDNAPQVGDPLPNIVVHDALGNPVNIRDLANENYKVLVLGCLT